MLRAIIIAIALGLLGLGVFRLGEVAGRIDAVDARLAENHQALRDLRSSVDAARDEASRARRAVERHVAGAPLVAQLAKDIESLREEVFEIGERQ